MFKLLGRIWKLFSSNVKWHILWLFHSKFIIGVSGVIFSDNGQVLLLKHRFWKNDSWGLPSGYIQKREKLEDAIKREVKEETELAVEVTNLLNINSGFKLRLEITYIGYCQNISTLKINGDEILEAKFFPVDELPQGLLESHRKLIEKASSYKK